MGRRRPATNCRQHFTPDKKQNEMFEKYYKDQVVPDYEWEDFVNYLKKDLPITFRVTGFRSQNKELLRLIKQKYRKDISEMQQFMCDEKEKSNGTFDPLPWYPDEMAWQLSASKYAVRKTEELRTLQQFLVSETESGKLNTPNCFIFNLMHSVVFRLAFLRTILGRFNSYADLFMI